MAAAKKNLVIEDNGNRRKVFVWKDKAGKPINLTGCYVELSVKKDINSPLLVEASTDNGKIVLTATKGKIEITFTEDDARLIGANGACIYDLIVVPEGGTSVPIRLIEGKFTVSVGVSRR